MSSVRARGARDGHYSMHDSDAAEFQILGPTGTAFADLERRFPANVFSTRAYAAAMERTGMRAEIIVLRRGGQLVTGCTALLRQGRLARALEIPSLPPIETDAQCFWSGLLRHCHKSGVTELDVQTFGSDATSIPRIAPETRRAKRVEFVVDLDGGDPYDRLDKKHKQSITKARQSGLVFGKATGASALETHCRLMSESLDRHRDRGEQVGFSGETDLLRVLLETGAAQLYQVSSADRVLSSATVLRSPRGAYYHTAGNHPDGLSLGASHLLVSEIARTVAAEGCVAFNLGGTDPTNEGLVRFKRRFGARPVELEAATFAVGGPVRRGIVTIARRLRGAFKRGDS